MFIFDKFNGTMKPSSRYIILLLTLFISNNIAAQNSTKQQIVERLTRSLNKFYLASKTKITLDEEIISFNYISFKETSTFNFNTVEISLYENETGTYLRFSCLDSKECIYSTKEHYHPMIGIPISCSEKDASQMLKDFLNLQKIIRDESNR